MSWPARILMIGVAVGIWYGLAVIAIGGFAAMFAHPALVALAIVGVAMVVASLFAGGNLSPGEREDRGNRWVLIAFTVIGLLDGFLPALCDRFGFWVIDGETTRWIGVAISAVAGVFRIWPVYVLGDRFSGLVAIQPEHRLVTDGLYAVIRHPSYLGLLVSVLGWALAFRSGVGVAIAVLMLLVLLARIEAEERLLSETFGGEYDAYRARTWRLIPYVY